jgi:hypothetical protein
VTLYQIWREENGMLVSLGERDERRPETAIERVARERHANGDADAATGFYVAALTSAVTRVEVEIEPSVKVTINSDREIKPRGKKEETSKAAENGNAPAAEEQAAEEEPAAAVA